MTRIIALALAIAAGAAASASEAKPDAATTTAITERLTAEGYEVRKIEREDGLFEAYAMKDGNRYEIYLDTALNVVRTERDD